MVGFGLSTNFGLVDEGFPRESQSCMTDLRRIGWRFLAFLWMEDFKGMLSKSEFFFSMRWIGGDCVNLRID